MVHVRTALTVVYFIVLQNESLVSMASRSEMDDQVNRLLQRRHANIFVAFCRGNPTTQTGRNTDYPRMCCVIIILLFAVFLIIAKIHLCCRNSVLTVYFYPYNTYLQVYLFM